MGTRRRILVAGAGIAGLAAAVSLARRGFYVVVYDPEGVGAGATGLSAGILTLQLPEPPLGWALESLRIYEALGAARRVPGVLVAPRDCVESLTLQEKRLDAERASRLLGVAIALPAGWSAGYTMDAVIDVSGTLESLRSTQGLEVRVAPAPPPQDALRSEYDYIVVAAGAWTPEILGVDPVEIAGSRIYNCEASSVSLPPGTNLEAILYVEDGEEFAYAVPESWGRAIIGDGPNRPLESPAEASPEPGAPYEVLEVLSRASPVFEEAYPQTAWAAPCLVTGDGLPAVGPWDEGVYVFTGFDGYGLMAAPALAEVLADIILGRREPLEELDPHRRVKPWSGEGPPPEPFRGCGHDTL